MCEFLSVCLFVCLFVCCGSVSVFVFSFKSGIQLVKNASELSLRATTEVQMQLC